MNVFSFIARSFFGAMFSGRWDTTVGEDECIFVDRDPFIFPHILNYSRGEEIPFEDLTQE
jgi:hypothetical protein